MPNLQNSVQSFDTDVVKNEIFDLFGKQESDASNKRINKNRIFKKAQYSEHFWTSILFSTEEVINNSGVFKYIF